MSQSLPPSPETVSALLILVTVFHIVALILTSFRLWFRYHIRQLWWDDFWAVIALLCDDVCMVVVWIVNAPTENPYTNIEALPTPPQSRIAHITAIWLGLVFYTCSIWFARISIVFSVLRIVPPARSVRIAAFGACMLLVSMWAYILACKSVSCSVDDAWYHSLYLRCPLPYWVSLSEVCTDALSDAILVALPLRLLWRVKLPSNQRIMVLSVFSTSLLVTVASAVHTATLIPQVVFTAGFTAHVESAVSIIVCNLLVVVTFFYRVVNNGKDLAEGVSGNTWSSNRLTTIDLDVSGSSQPSSMGTALTGSNISSGMIISTSEKDTSYGSVIASGGSVPQGL